MSDASELRAVFEELQDMPECLREDITRNFAKMTALKLFDGENAFQRSSARLDARQRAYYRKLGMPIEPEDEVPITNILGDVTLAQKDESSRTVPDPPAPRPPDPAPAPPVEKARGPSWAGLALATALAGGLPAAGLAGYLLRTPANTVTAIDSNERTVIGLSVED